MAFENKYVTYGLYLLLVVALVLISYYIYTFFKSVKKANGYTPDRENGTNEEYSGNTNNVESADITLWYASWCPACKSIMNDWKETKQKRWALTGSLPPGCGRAARWASSRCPMVLKGGRSTWITSSPAREPRQTGSTRETQTLSL